MTNSFQIDIITPVENINIGTSEYLRAPNLEGLFGVQARHVSSIISVGSGEIKGETPFEINVIPNQIEIIIN